MKLTVEKLREFLARYNSENAGTWLITLFGYQWPIHNIIGKLDGDNKVPVIEYLREFFKNRINPRSTSFQVLKSCFLLDGADAAFWYETFIILESRGLVSEAVYDKVIKHPAPNEFVEYIANLDYYLVLNRGHLEYALDNPSELQKIKNAFAIITSFPAPLLSKTLEFAESHAQPEVLCKSAQMIAKFLTPENLTILNSAPNIEKLVAAMEVSLAPVQMLTEPFFQLIAGSTEPQYFADLILIFTTAELIDLLFDNKDYFLNLKQLHNFWNITNGINRAGLLNRDNIGELMDLAWLDSSEASEILVKQQNFVWDEDLLSEFITAAKNQKAATKVQAFFAKNSQHYVDIDPDELESGIRMTMISLSTQ